LAGLLGFLLVVLGMGGLPRGRAATPPMLDHFSDQPADALIHRLQPADDDVSSAQPGLVVSRKARWLPELRLLVVNGTLANKSALTTSVRSVSIGQWDLRVSEGQGAIRYEYLTYRNDTWYGSTYWTGPGWTRVGKDWHHPGDGIPSVRRFTAPRDGRVSVTGRVYKAHLDGDGIRATIRHGARTLWSAEIDGKDDKGVEPKLTFQVRSGDAIRFLVHQRGHIYCDTTRWDPIVTYDDGQRHQASEAFSTTRQGHGGWFYEMEPGPNAEYTAPHLHALGLSLAGRDESLGVGQTVEVSDQDVLPFWVVADSADRSGIILALVPSGTWRCCATATSKGLLRIRLSTGDEKAPLRLRPGESMPLPTIILGAYRGNAAKGMNSFERTLRSKHRDPCIDALRKHIAAMSRRAFAPLDPLLGSELGAVAPPELPELDLWIMVQAEWRQEDRITEKMESYASATARHLERGRLLLADLRGCEKMGLAPGPRPESPGKNGLARVPVPISSQPLPQSRTDDLLATEARQFECLAKLAARRGLNLDQQRALYYHVRLLKRKIALANPLMSFRKLLFCKRVPTSYSHLVMQYFGWRAQPGGGIFILERPGQSLDCRDILNGTLQHGNVLEPRLSYDAKRVVFSWVNCGAGSRVGNEVEDPAGESFYHLYEVSVDGAQLKQLTSGPYDDLMPAYLPDGGIAFSSTRRRGYARCFGGQFGKRWHVYTLHRCDGDGGSIRTLSFHDTNEWFPTVDNNGRVLYARWDYIDRDAVTHQNLWGVRPDGTNPMALWGNATPNPHCTFQMKPIPGSGRIVFIASAHHSITAGSVCILDPTVDYDGLRPLTRITPEVPFPEAESRNIQEYYTSPWPLSERYFLVGYSPKPLVWEPGANPSGALGIYLLDTFGNRELIYRDPEIGSTNPTPLVARPLPPVLPSELDLGVAPTGEMLLMDVYQGLGDVPRGSIKKLRIIQVYPKTTVVANNPKMGIAGEENGRAILGTVPVEPDGSARFIVPARKPILFQALDSDGFAYQTMRSVTYLQPGERVACVGCHENRMTAPTPARAMAPRRAPSEIDPGPLGGRPFSFVEMVQPVLDKHCVKCHGGDKIEGKTDLTRTPAGPWTKSYASLCRDPKLVPRFPARNQIQVTPVGGMHGALGSGLMKLLREDHEGVTLSSDEIRRLAAWIDCNAIFYGTPNPADHGKQLRGEPVPMPEIQ